ncbi:MAG: tripartite tricarboxylate transporter substrate binding protein BugD [Methylobacterium sp.]|nr:tripartite tricarboxylate transporter substrate binding protein BugD [Methylobacterium sp.]MCA3655823.1 tripartite tricarboxylate transporter substrate binding protein BugD [Methylobacterium sp.]MCA3657483.1 tripartite tricarboxylate transporter substrate binding protein BugD [Methylobacterium sp.]MCA3661771.1 tripartite tricarboxylate transporter substrate binding protein BugD [Methylobacterium sp.]MCA3664204.1 tripartite tricarboxylate transporter substrate binding protein BugD [Methylobac
MSFTRRLFMAGSALLLGIASAAAQAFPNKPITMIVPFAAGGPTDTIARIVGEHMSRTLGQTIVIENVAGAGGTTGITRAAKSTPDGYTIAMGHMGTHGAAAGLYPNLGYDPQKDFEPIGLAAGTPIVIVARKDFPANNLQEFMKYVQANQKTLNAAHAGVGSVSHITCVLLHSMLKVDVNEIPYRGTGPAINDLVAGKVDYVCDQIVSVSEQVKGGTIRAYGIATPARSPSLPDVPTTIEGGLPEFQVSAWNAVFAPKGTPPDVLAKLRDALVKAVTDPGTRKKLEDLGGVVPDARGASPEALAELVRSENTRWVALLKERVKQ